MSVGVRWSPNASGEVAGSVSSSKIPGPFGDSLKFASKASSGTAEDEEFSMVVVRFSLRAFNSSLAFCLSGKKSIKQDIKKKFIYTFISSCIITFKDNQTLQC